MLLSRARARLKERCQCQLNRAVLRTTARTPSAANARTSKPASASVQRLTSWPPVDHPDLRAEPFLSAPLVALQDLAPAVQDSDVGAYVEKLGEQRRPEVAGSTHDENSHFLVSLL